MRDTFSMPPVAEKTLSVKNRILLFTLDQAA
jgi:hypothetical protein